METIPITAAGTGPWSRPCPTFNPAATAAKVHTPSCSAHTGACGVWARQTWTASANAHIPSSENTGNTTPVTPP